MLRRHKQSQRHCKRSSTLAATSVWDFPRSRTMPRARIIDTSTPWIAMLRSVASTTLNIRVTDLIGFYECTSNEVDIQQQLQVAGISTTVEQAFDRLLSGFDDGLNKDTFHTFQVRPCDHISVTFEWLVRGSVKLAFRCAASVEPAPRIRDELVLPLMRATEQLRLLVPPAASETQAQWEPPHTQCEGSLTVPHVQQLPLANLNAPLLAQILEHAGPDRPTTRAPTGPDAAACASAVGANAPSLPQDEASAGAYRSLAVGAADNLAAVAFEPASASMLPLDPSGLSEESDDMARKRRAREERERKANKKIQKK